MTTKTQSLHSIERRLLIIERMIADIYDATVENKKTCPVCGERIRLYVPAGNPLRRNAACPACGCLERHRLLWLYLKKHNPWDGKERTKILHFAPERALFNHFDGDKRTDYFPVDSDGRYEGLRDIVDMQSLPYPDCEFDMIVCNHVLEHIPDDAKAISEMHRILKPGGRAYVTVPIDSNLKETFEDASFDTPELRFKHYGQDDHVRTYGRDFEDRLSLFDLSVIVPRSFLSAEEIETYALTEEEKLFVCTKRKA
jgi:SAM-dependent methyltransferase